MCWLPNSFVIERYLLVTYRTKVRTIEAFRWTGQPRTEWPAWATPQLLSESSHLGLYAHTLQGPVRVNRGGWCILGDKEIYPCTDEEFHKRYEPVPFADQPSDSPPNLGDE